MKKDDYRIEWPENEKRSDEGSLSYFVSMILIIVCELCVIYGIALIVNQLIKEV